jgi:hypothetical protein
MSNYKRLFFVDVRRILLGDGDGRVDVGNVDQPAYAVYVMACICVVVLVEFWISRPVLFQLLRPVVLVVLECTVIVNLI